MKKWLIKTSCILLCLLFVVLSACNNSPNLYQKGIEITTIMGEMVNSETYVEMMNIPKDSDMDLVKAKDYDTPTRVYKISIPAFDSFVQNMESLDETQFNDLSHNLKEQVKNKFTFLRIIAYLNNSYGYHETVLFTCFSVDKTFEGKMSLSEVYLFTFETGKAIVVLFEPFGEKQFTAKGRFVFAEDLSSLSKVREVFEPFGCTVENVN